MSLPNVDRAREILSQHLDPETGRPLGTMGQIQEVMVEGASVTATIGLTSYAAPIAEELRELLTSKLVAAFPGTEVTIRFQDHPRPAARIGQIGLRAKSVIVVGSGKGGVGKSTVAAGLALTLHRLGASVGLMDADVYGPSIPHLLGLSGRPAVSQEKRIQPIRCSDGFPVMSMGFLVEPDQAVIWRGPMLHGAVQQFLADTEWGELDYLVIDMPPGTGDIALTLSQAVPVSGAVVVCTPQEVALLDAVKAISMFRKVQIPVAGMVENMSGFVCPDCGKTYDIFGTGGAREKAEALEVPFLGGLPIDISLRIAGDEGRLAEALREDDRARAPFEAVAKALVRNFAERTAASPPKPTLPTL